MPGESKAFHEVRALLNKLDRSIDEARSKRTGPKDEPANRSQVASENRSASRTDLDREIGAPRNTNAPMTPMQAKRAQYGRARPLNAPESNGARPASDSQWKSPKNYDDLSIG
ncbi:MAG: hypothetical protein LAT64_10685 [Phycisphaerales bacterium]|nr:hypothetical protein [Planctomycetota bacterium]MCH8509217.1 hypothetical protein [Phycisphaerales bacterium]